MERANAIRKLFIEHRDDYSMEEAAELVGWSSRQMVDEIAASELRRVELASRVSWHAVASIAVTMWSLQAIEDALGKNASILPPLARLTDCTVRLPQYQVLAIETAARMRGVTMNEFLAGYLLDLVCTAAPALIRNVPGFREAFMWPQPVDRQTESAAF